MIKDVEMIEVEKIDPLFEYLSHTGIPQICFKERPGKKAVNFLLTNSVWDCVASIDAPNGRA